MCDLLTVRPELTHRLPAAETRRGRAWPSPRSWEMTVRLLAFGSAAGSSREVLSMLVRGTVGDGPGVELLAAVDRMDLPAPEDLLADPDAAVLPERGDLRQVALDAVVSAVRSRPTRQRWDAAWTLMAHALRTGSPDVLVVPVTTLVSLRQPDWEVPALIERFEGALELSRRADRAAARIPATARAGRR
ncbi:ATPase AAA [Kitasatospora cheerisanensis KCTC 2395]|uniref:ATPase AAA n=1 Tax=Kitasatospora cheerisanensis KCTC 2395 TaxID=1348663 RepID=A0A066YIN7_9ACTN|nr:ATPase AAA [Kitasatospora cheerisanensis KCTC 2395]